MVGEGGWLYVVGRPDELVHYYTNRDITVSYGSTLRANEQIYGSSLTHIKNYTFASELIASAACFVNATLIKLKPRADGCKIEAECKRNFSEFSSDTFNQESGSGLWCFKIIEV